MRALGFAEVQTLVRSLLRTPTFTAIVVVQLALGVGGATAIFSVVKTVLLEPLPYPEADQLVIVWQRAPGAGLEREWLSPAQFRDIRDESTSFDELALLVGGPSLLNRDGPPEHSSYVQANAALLRMLGAQPHLGRILTEADDAPDAPPVLLITYELWQRRFGGDPNILGRKIGVERFEVPVVGVLAPGFLLDDTVFPFRERVGAVEMVNSMRMSEEHLERRDHEGYNIVGKLAHDVTLTEAQAELDVIASRMTEAAAPAHGDRGFRLDVVPLLDQVVGASRPRLWLLLGTVSLMLAAACMNVANLSFFRGSVRSREMGIRSALGAGRLRILAKVIGESLVLGMIGCALGIALAWAALTTMARWAGAGLPRMDEIEFDAGVVVLAVGVSLFASVLAAVIPAFHAARVDVVSAIRRGDAGTRPLPRKLGSSSVLAILQVAVALILIVCTQMLWQSFDAVLSVDPGFESENKLTMRVQASPGIARSAIETDALFATLVERVEALPGVRSGASGWPLPLSPGSSWAPVDVEGYERAPEEPAIVADERNVSPGYFETMGISILEGRDFNARDYLPDAPPVVIVDRRFAERFWPNDEALGQRVRPAWMDSFATVTGIVAPVRQYALTSESRIAMYLPERGAYRPHLAVATEGDPRRWVDAVTRALRDVDPEIATSDVKTMTDRVDELMAPARLSLGIVQSVAAVVLLIATAGLYGLLGFSVSAGRSELGLRVALGATPGDVTRLVVAYGMRIAAIGVSIGLIAGVATAGLLDNLLFEVEARPMFGYVAAAFPIGIVSFFAVWLPARRAARVHPLAALGTNRV